MSYISPSAIVKGSNLDAEVSIYKYAEISNSKIGNKVKIGDNAMVIDSEIDSNCSINRRNYILRSKIGRFSYTGINTIIRSTELGKFCSISWNISIGGGNHKMNKLTTSTKERFYSLDGTASLDVLRLEAKKRISELSSCVIGNDVWIGAGAIINGGVRIGDGALIGAAAVVTKDVEPYTIVAGIPARPIKKRFSEQVVEELIDIKWWDWPIEIIRNNLDLIYSETVDIQLIEKLKSINEGIKYDN